MTFVALGAPHPPLSLSPSLPPTHKNGNYCIVNQVVWSWAFDKQQACHMQWANYFLGLCQRAAISETHIPLWEFCVSMIPISFLHKLFKDSNQL
jgi:hypothetical protein